MMDIEWCAKLRLEHQWETNEHIFHIIVSSPAKRMFFDTNHPRLSIRQVHLAVGITLPCREN